MLENIHNLLIEDETQLQQIAENLALQLKPGDRILFFGDMGVGKTTFIAKLCMFLGADSISSPTFTLINRYNALNNVIYHMDLYRMNNEKDLISLDLDRYFEDPKAIVLVEWSEKLQTWEPKPHIRIDLAFPEPFQATQRIYSQQLIH